MQEQKSRRRLIVVGDVHGHFEPFVKILRQAGLVDSRLNWAGGRERLLQMGDIFDRGPSAKETDILLDKLQQQAQEAGGEVIRLVGNHELEMMLSQFEMSGLQGVEAIHRRDKLNKQVLGGQLRAAYAYKGFLFTHAGVTARLFKIFRMQLEDATAANVAALINLIFKESVKHQFFKHPIFNISLNRNGTNKFGGIFWEDLTDLVQSFTSSPVWQVIGHTPVNHILIDPVSRLIPVDVGLQRRMQYLIINEAGEPSIQEVLPR
ncbi:MAG: metallophosphoesterase [Elusimicrobiaceae bacterium]|nr:metallophosphoesterase [Elusimicrobiaceae bacterium]